MPETEPQDRAAEVLLRLLAGFFALTWFGLPGFGLIDLAVTLNPDPSWQGVLEGGWGLYMTLFVGVPFTAIAVRGRSAAAPYVAVLHVATVALIVSALVAAEVQAFVLAVVLGLETVIITGRPTSWTSRMRLRVAPQPLLVPLVLGAVPWLIYAWAMWTLNRQDRPDQDITIGVDHYSVQGAYALALLALVALAALWPAGRVFTGVIAGLSAAYLGAVSWVWHPTPGSFDQRWSALCLCWGIAVMALAVLTRPRTATPSGMDRRPRAQPGGAADGSR